MTQTTISLDEGDDLRARLLALGTALRPIDDENYYFFEIVRELVDASLTNYDQMRQGYVAGNYLYWHGHAGIFLSWRSF